MNKDLGSCGIGCLDRLVVSILHVIIVSSWLSVFMVMSLRTCTPHHLDASTIVDYLNLHIYNICNLRFASECVRLRESIMRCVYCFNPVRCSSNNIYIYMYICKTWSLFSERNGMSTELVAELISSAVPIELEKKLPGRNNRAQEA